MSVARWNKGFSLIELLIVVAIIAIVAAFGYPSYQESVRRAARTEAQSVLSAAASDMERHKAVSLSYANATAGTGATDTMTNRSPASGSIKYDLSIVGTPTANTYVLRAASTDAQDGDSGESEIMMINQAGQTCIATRGTSADVCTFGTDPAW